MKTPAAIRHPITVQRLLQACGVNSARSWWELLLSWFFKLPAPDANGPSWQTRLACLFPHIDFHQLRPADLIRIPLQVFWLILRKPPRSTGDLQSPEGARRGRLTAAHYKKEEESLQHTWKGRSRKIMQVLPFLSIAKKWAHNLRNRLPLSPDRMRTNLDVMAGHPVWDHPLVRYGAYAVSGILTFLCITTPFNTLTQAIFVALLWIIALLIRKIPGQVTTLLLIVLSVTTSTRYVWWRVNYTMNGDDYFDLMWSLLLLGAELYTWFILLTGFLQTAWTLNRQPTALPSDPGLWPTVDFYITTYNEPLKVVKPTIYAALDIDWPKDKLNIYLLDDGRREEFRLFAEAMGVGYVTRPDNRDAKAGNLNHALTKTNGEFIAIFDCDHIPTRSFLQVSMGGFMKDPKLALVQTPHHFFSPDPFERNLGLFRRIPNEGELFYGLIQNGNDLWNATFFCGSCAILRRAPLEEIGGIALETVTEDAHTSLKLHRRGYTSAYINIPQSAGLATESLSAHISQRIRWARGMIQIFRLDNPFFGRGLTWAQRICYSNAMMHFLNGVPRLIFLVAPLVFLFFHAYVIYAPAISVVLYVLPHIVHATIANSRTQNNVRHSFWAEVYESVLAWYIAVPTTLALFNPHKGKFNVTAKGGLVERNYYDFTISLPYLTLVSLNLIGFGLGIWRIYTGPVIEIPTVVLNLFWCLYNIITLGGALAVAGESKQVRLSHRVRMQLPAILHLPDGKLIQCRTEDFSEGGAAIVPALIPQLNSNDPIGITLWQGEEELTFPARVIATSATLLTLRWELQNPEQEAALVRCTFARADAWISWSKDRKVDHPLEGLREVAMLGIRGYWRLGRQLLPVIRPLANSALRTSSRIAWWLPRNPLPIATR